jgi:hypothetical protein
MRATRHGSRFVAGPVSHGAANFAARPHCVKSIPKQVRQAAMSRDIYINAIGHDQPDGYFLVREKGRPDHRIDIPKDMSLFDALKAIAAAHGADSMHIGLSNDLTAPPTIQIIAHLPLDERRPVKKPISN